MERLCKAFDEAIGREEIDALLLIPMFVLDFLCIHPFNEKEVTKGDANISTFQPKGLIFLCSFQPDF